MAATKDEKTGKWEAAFYYKDWQGKRQRKHKRGFATKREALEWERTFLQQQTANLDMSFSAFVEIYESDINPKLKINTWLTKLNVIQTKLLPYFGDKPMNAIIVPEILKWQNEMRESCDKSSKPYSLTYLRKINCELSAIFNHAVRFYELKSNPVTKAGSMGRKNAGETNFWTRTEYLKFADAMRDKTTSYYAFQILYWCGLRLGELLALTTEDFDFTKKTIRINKSFQRLKSEDLITEPKTRKVIVQSVFPIFFAKKFKTILKLFTNTRLMTEFFSLRSRIFITNSTAVAKQAR